MVILELRFPTGYYHATPSDHHVNEGIVEWPPSPWRILRALLATGFTKLHWGRDGMPEAARALLATLAARPPVYDLPGPVTHAHTRHYLPVPDGNKDEKRVLVLDAFAYVGRQRALRVRWPVQPPPQALALLDALLPRLSWLGRAESLVEARRLAEAPESATAWACAPMSETPDSGGREALRLLAPESEESYARWSAEERERLTAQARRDAESKGRKLTPKKAEKLTASVPATLLDAMLLTTREVKAHAYGQAPGSRRIEYARPRGALAVTGSGAPPSRSVEDPRPHCVLLSLSTASTGRPILPRQGQAVRVAEALHGALARTADGRALPSVLAGRAEDGAPLKGHRHAHLLPLCSGGDRRITHLLLWAPLGFDGTSRDLLERVERLYLRGRPQPRPRSAERSAPPPNEFLVTEAGAGSPRELARMLRGLRQSGFAPRLPDLFGPARTWTSATPFVPARHLKRRGGLEREVRAECARRDLPPPAQVRVHPPADLVARGFFAGFECTRRPGRPQPPQPSRWCLTLVWDEEQSGPLALGYGSHFGLGLFEALDGPRR